MKQIIRNLALAAVSLLAMATLAAAQRPQGGNRWMERMRSERIAFLTAETGMTPAEAEKFWPLYNEAEKTRMEAFGKSMQAYGELEKAVDDGKPAKEIEQLLNTYLNAQKVAQDVDSNYAKKYLKVLSAEKVAKLFVAEEKFRRNQIGRLHIGAGRGTNNKNTNGK